jgi:hypothetical protein
MGALEHGKNVTRSLSLVKKRLAEDAACLSLDIAERKIIKEHYDRLRMRGSLILIGPLLLPLPYWIYPSVRAE